MLPKFPPLHCGVLLLIFLCTCAGVLPSVAQLTELDTEDLRLVYIAPGQSYLAPHVARCFENSLHFHRHLFDYQPDGPVTVILTDFSDFGNAGAGAVPRTGVAVSIGPMSHAYETYPANERMNTLMNHELVHVVNFDLASGSDRFFRRLFSGKVKGRSAHPETILYNYLTAPRASAPRWFHEGIATFVETWMAGGIGRAQGSYDEMVFRAMVADDTPFYNPLSLVSEGTKSDFQVEMNSYLYGTRFMSWVAWKYSPEKLIEWVRRSPGSKGYHAHQFDALFDRSLDDAWQEWVRFEHEFQQANLDSLRRYPITTVNDIGHEGLGSISRAFYDRDGGKIYAALNYPGIVAHIAAIDARSGEIDRLVDVKGPTMYTVTSLARDPERGTLFYTTDNGAFRDIVELDPSTRKTRVLLKDGRVGDLAFDASDRSLWGIRHDAGFSTLVRVPWPWTEWHQVHTFDYGTTPYDLDVSPDGQRIVFSVLEPSGKADIRIFEREALLAGDLEPAARLDFGTTAPMNFVFDDSGEKLLGTTYLTGVSNVFRVDPATESWEALSNVETGLFRPIPAEGDSLIVFRFSGEGFVPARMLATPLEDINPIVFFGERLIDRYPVLHEWQVGSPALIDLDSLETRRGNYRGFRELEVEALYPIVEGYKQYTAPGLRLDLSDPISLHKISLTASYTPDARLDADERLHAGIDYNRHDWRLAGRYNGADFYDLLGPTRTSRKGWSVSAGHTSTLLYDMPRKLTFDISASYYGGLERLPQYQNVVSSFEELLTGSIRLDFTNLKFSLGAVDYEKGVKAWVALNDNHVNGRSFPLANASFQFGLPLFRHSSFWLRSYAGAGKADRAEPFANFFLGGFGNNWIDHRETKRYREWYAMPGFELNELGGTNFVKLTGDWNLPPLRFGSLGRPALYASWIRASIFGTGLVTNADSAALRTSSASIGAQLDLRMTLLSHHDFTASVGYALGMTEDLPSRDEFMFSLRIH